MTRRVLAAAAAAAAAVLLALAPAASGAQFGPLCSAFGAILGLDETVVRGFVGTLPDAPTRTFCDWLNEEMEPTAACDYLSLLYYGLTGGGDTSPRACDPAEAAAAQQTGNWGALPARPLRDRRPLPADDFPDAASVYQEEGAAYWLLFQLAENAHVWAPCAPQAGLGGLALPPGWVLDRAANLSQAAGPPLPLVYVLRNEASNQVLLLLRPTAGSYEWALNFAFNTTDRPELAELFGNASLPHGMASAFLEVWPQVQGALDELVTGADPAPQVWVAGYSMGAAVGNLLAYAAQGYLDERMGAAAPVISSVGFSPPQAGDANFAAAFNQRVNHRDIAFADDLLNLVPCEPSMPACPAKPSGLLGAIGVTGIATDQGNATSHPFARVGGRLPFLPADMPQDQAAWDRIDTMPLCWTPSYLAAAHLCSYRCYLAQHAPQPEADNLCWLSPKPGGAAGSQCPTFPNAWITPGYDGSATDGAAPAPAPVAAPRSAGGGPAPGRWPVLLLAAAVALLLS